MDDTQEKALLNMSQELAVLLKLLPVDKEVAINTPGRWYWMYMHELLVGYSAVPPGLRTFKTTGENMVVIRNIEFFSLCEHHLLPFFGSIHIGYIPDGFIAGLSKFGRVVKYFSRRLQLQERLTDEIADYIELKLKPKGLGVMVEAEHLCMKMRGIESFNSCTSTLALRGSFKSSPDIQRTFYRLLGVHQEVTLGGQNEELGCAP